MTPDEIAEAIKQHDTENPTHGLNCSCMDRYAYLLAEQLKAFATPISMWLNPDSLKLAQRYTYVLSLTTKGLNR